MCNVIFEGGSIALASTTQEDYIARKWWQALHHVVQTQGDIIKLIIYLLTDYIIIIILYL